MISYWHSTDFIFCTALHSNRREPHRIHFTIDYNTVAKMLFSIFMSCLYFVYFSIFFHPFLTIARRDQRLNPSTDLNRVQQHLHKKYRLRPPSLPKIINKRLPSSWIVFHPIISSTLHPFRRLISIYTTPCTTCPFSNVSLLDPNWVASPTCENGFRSIQTQKNSRFQKISLLLQEFYFQHNKFSTSHLIINSILPVFKNVFSYYISILLHFQFVLWVNRNIITVEVIATLFANRITVPSFN